MAGAIVGLHVFANDVGPEPLANLDNNFSPLAAAINSLNTFSNYYLDSGAVNALVVTLAAGQVATFGDGLMLEVTVGNTSTSTTPTLNFNSTGAKTITQWDGTALLPGALVAQGRYIFMYDGTNWRVLNPSAAFFGIGAQLGPSLQADGQSGLTSFTGLVKLGLMVSGANSTNDFSGIDFSDTGAVRKASIAAEFTGGGSILSFGTSNNYGSGITQSGFQLDQNGVLSAIDQGGTMQVVGWRDAPPNTQNANYTLALSDRGKTIQRTGGTGPFSWTIPPVGSVAFSPGAIINFVVAPGVTGACTLTQGAGVTITWLPTAANGNRTLSASGCIATAYMPFNNVWYVWGAGIS